METDLLDLDQLLPENLHLSRYSSPSHWHAMWTRCIQNSISDDLLVFCCIFAMTDLGICKGVSWKHFIFVEKRRYRFKVVLIRLVLPWKIISTRNMFSQSTYRLQGIVNITLMEDKKKTFDLKVKPLQQSWQSENGAPEAEKSSIKSVYPINIESSTANTCSF